MKTMQIPGEKSVIRERAPGHSSINHPVKHSPAGAAELCNSVSLQPSEWQQWWGQKEMFVSWLKVHENVE